MFRGSAGQGWGPSTFSCIFLTSPTVLPQKTSSVSRNTGGRPVRCLKEEDHTTSGPEGARRRTICT